MVRKQVKCQRCNRTFWSPIKKAYILIGKKGEKRVVKGAFMKRTKADKEKAKLEKKLCPKKFDKIDIEPQATIQKFLCQRCQNTMSSMQTRSKHQKAVKKQIRKNRPTRVIPKEEVAKFIRYQVNRKVLQDYRKNQQENARKERMETIKRKEKKLEQLQREKEKLKLKMSGETKKPMGKDK